MEYLIRKANGEDPTLEELIEKLGNWELQEVSGKVVPSRQVNKEEEMERITKLAEMLDCFTEEEHLLLSGWSPKTSENYRKRGDGPPYIRHGRNYFYPKKEYAEYLRKKLSSTRRGPGVL